MILITTVVMALSNYRLHDSWLAELIKLPGNYCKNIPSGDQSNKAKYIDGPLIYDRVDILTKFSADVPFNAIFHNQIINL